MTRSEFAIERAKPVDLPRIPEVEARAAARFASEDLPAQLAARALPVETLRVAQKDGRLWVARSERGVVVGFALVAYFGSDAILEELDVEPEYGRQGIGRRLVEAVCDWASETDLKRIILSTFRDVAWNAPFYSRLGFREIPCSDWTLALRSLRSEEAELGLDITRRVLMARPTQFQSPSQL